MGDDGGRNLPAIFWSCWASARWPYPSFCALLSWRFLSARTAPGTAWKLVGCALLLASLALVAKLFVETGLLDGRTWERPGGFVGEEPHRIFSPLVGRAGLPLLGLTTLLLGVVCLSSRPLASLSARCRTVVERVAARVKERRASRAHQPGRIRPPYTPPTEDGPAVEARPTSVVVVEPVAVSTVREPIPRQLEPTTTGDLPPQGSFPFVTPEAGFQPPRCRCSICRRRRKASFPTKSGGQCRDPRTQAAGLRGRGTGHTGPAWTRHYPI
ncbi:MAG: DNA translocase FtsK 4TM domain-containing protein [Candidatus Methylomirabilis sp.]|nr:DNA translocase FtsK 4TM domain-containing protein [Candidatus Methylomirabilis sp.]